MDKINEEVKEITYDAIRIGLASDDKIREWARAGRPGEVTDYEVKKPETINYRTLKPETGGLFCEKIFGPTKKFECHCGKYKKQKVRAKNFVCDRCGVEVTDAKVRRERMGYIELAAPVSHIWYFKSIPSRMGLLLDMTPKNLEKVLYFTCYVVLDGGNTPLKKKDILTEAEYNRYIEEYGEDSFTAQMGAEAIRKLLEEIDLDALSAELEEELSHCTGQKRVKPLKRLEVVDAFRESGNRPEWMILKCIPVIPPDLRPMVQLDGGRFATSDLNDLYRRIINRNNRLQRLISLGAPEIIIRNEKRMLQEAVDALNDNGRRGRPVTGPGNRALKSLSDLLKGKQGRFRQNLLGKRVDYSGRSVIVVGPELKIYQCGLPKEMAIELFKPFVMKELMEQKKANNIRAAKKMVERLEPGVWDVLEKVIQEHPVMLNRAPTLHRLGIQAFEPILVEGKAIKLHPLVCTAFNADFDGDQMAVHLPLSVEAQAECRFLLLSPNNLLKPSDGGPVAVPSQDMVLGIYYLTMEKPGDKGEGMYFKNENEAILAYENGYVTLQSRIHVRRTGINAEGKEESRTIDTTVGRILFNEIISQDLGFVDRTRPENFLKYEIDFLVKKGELKKILERCINTHGAIKTAETLDAVKAIGYKFSTRAAMTVSLADVIIPPNREGILRETEEKVEKINNAYEDGLTSADERYKKVIETWQKTDERFENEALDSLDKYNNILMMADSGARGNKSQIKQLIGMRGLFTDTTGKTIELPIKSNLRSGLDVLEYFISAHGARKALSDTALRTADSGYLTRRLVDVSQELIIREVDCCAGMDEIPGMDVRMFQSPTSKREQENEGGEEKKEKPIETLAERITGRFACEDYYDDNGDLIVRKNQMITPRRAERLLATKAIKDAGADATIRIRTALTCHSHYGICAKCYGANMATGEPVQVGEAVGIIAAQSIGEPGTQLTMRTFHTGGVAGDNITTGLPRVEELFEARKPKGLAIVTEIPGKVTIRETSKNNMIKREAVVTNEETGESKAYLLPFGTKDRVKDGDYVQAGEGLTEGSLDPHDILKINGLRAVQDYMLREVQQVYRKQGVEINDKHIEIILHQMLKKVLVEECGDTGFLPGTHVDVLDFEETNARMLEEGKKPAEGKRIILGITKASLATNSFLSAASFQETTKVLTDAAIKGKIDPLVGLKENVILGKLIPAGTGMKEYRNIHLNTDNEVIERAESLDDEYRKSIAESDVLPDKTENLLTADEYEDDGFSDEEFDNIIYDDEDLEFEDEDEVFDDSDDSDEQ